MNRDLTEIAFILDRSGSMSAMAIAAISGFNEFLREQQSEVGQARLTLILFDDLYEVRASSLPVGEVVPLDTETYVPRGNTALLDAIGRTIDELGKQLAQLPEQDRPGQVIVAVLTDGLENASRHYDWHSVAHRIRHQTDVYQWHFLFLGANQDAIATAAQMGIDRMNSATYAADRAGHRGSPKAISRKMSAIRKSMAGEINPDLQAPMSEIVEEEDRKERGE